MTVHITAVHMEPTNANDHQHIASVRWENRGTGENDQSSRQQIMDWIRRGGDARVSDAQGDVRVMVVEANPPYIRTHADGRATDNLCPYRVTKEPPSEGLRPERSFPARSKQRRGCKPALVQLALGDAPRVWAGRWTWPAFGRSGRPSTTNGDRSAGAAVRGS